MAKFNPVSHWKVSKQAINGESLVFSTLPFRMLAHASLVTLAFAISPDQQLCATVGEDGCLRIIDLVEEKYVDLPLV